MGGLSFPDHERGCLGRFRLRPQKSPRVDILCQWCVLRRIGHRPHEVVQTAVFQYNTYWAQYFSTDPLKRYIACHELGHTFGLQHPKSNEPQATCMKSASADLSYVPTYNYISATEKNQIDLYYGSGQVSP